MSAVSGVENRTTVFNGFRSQPGMAMFIVIPGEELLGERARILKRPKTFREPRPVFRVRKWFVVVEDMGAAVGLGDAEVGHQKAVGLDVMEAPRSA